jgi:hypothetical protein
MCGEYLWGLVNACKNVDNVQCRFWNRLRIMKWSSGAEEMRYGKDIKRRREERCGG